MSVGAACSVATISGSRDVAALRPFEPWMDNVALWEFIAESHVPDKLRRARASVDEASDGSSSSRGDGDPDFLFRCC